MRHPIVWSFVLALIWPPTQTMRSPLFTLARGDELARHRARLFVTVDKDPAISVYWPIAPIAVAAA